MLGTEMVDIYVGKAKEKKHAHVHKALLTGKIPYFDKMFSGGFKEATDSFAEFPDEDVKAFENLIQWVYSGSLPRFQWIQDAEGEEGEFESSWCIAQTYLLFDKLCLFSLADQALTDFLAETAKLKIVMDFGLIQTIYKLAPERSPLRKLALQSFHFAMNGQTPDEVAVSNWDMEEVKKGLIGNGDFLLDYLTLMHKHNNLEIVQDPAEMPVCFFHHHGEGEPCFVKVAESNYD
ncbi:hypothetical protein N431DRAFT_349514 [Stipitochalara longipes BDJ]|nr:hypothetical protein N431DRAFT_349514 [Stipitochalara longipes BDJ]